MMHTNWYFYCLNEIFSTCVKKTVSIYFRRCNDVLELVQTTQHFRLLADAAEVGGAGSQSLDALVKEIHCKYTEAMHAFFDKVSNLLSIDGSQAFEQAFFTFRTVVKVSAPFVENSCVFQCIKNIINAEMWA